MEHLRDTTPYRTALLADRPEAPHAGESRELDKFFKALSDQTRRGILRLLEAREHSVGEIVDQFDLSQPTISRHLSVLKEADLVRPQRQGQRVIYHLNGDALSESVERFFGTFRPLHRRFR